MWHIEYLKSIYSHSQHLPGWLAKWGPPRVMHLSLLRPGAEILPPPSPSIASMAHGTNARNQWQIQVVGLGLLEARHLWVDNQKPGNVKHIWQATWFKRIICWSWYLRLKTRPRNSLGSNATELYMCLCMCAWLGHYWDYVKKGKPKGEEACPKDVGVDMAGRQALKTV